MADLSSIFASDDSADGAQVAQPQTEDQSSFDDGSPDDAGADSAAVAPPTPEPQPVEFG